MPPPSMLLAGSVCVALLWPAPAAAAPVVVEWDLDASDGGFSTDEELGVWDWGEPGSGPKAAFTGSRVWATVLDGDYINDNQAALVLPLVDLTGAERPVLRFAHWVNLRPGDEARLELLVDGFWEVIEPIYGYPTSTVGWVSTNGAWIESFVDLSDVADASHLRLNLSADGTGVSDGWYVDDPGIFDGDIVPPRIEGVQAPDDWSNMSQGPTIDAEVRDDVGLSSVAVVWSTATLNDRRTVMSALGDGQWSATLPALAPGVVVEWRIEASDGNNVATWPESGVGDIRVFLPSPTDLAAPGGRLWGLTVPLDWSPPDSDEVVDSYMVWRDDDLVGETTSNSFDAPALGPVDRFTVSAVFSTALGTFEGDQSDPLDVTVAVPTLTALSPDAAWQGDRVRVVLTGSQLLLDGHEDTLPSLDLGAGVTIEDVVVDTVDRAIFTLSIDATAAAGLRDASLLTDGLTLDLVDAFEILDGADRPTITAVTPLDLEQGTQGNLLISTNTSFDTTPVADLGEGIVVEGVTVEGGTIIVAVAVANDAPLGLRAVELDDGTRILVADDVLRIRARTARVGGCSTSGGSSTSILGALAGLIFGAGRRRLSAGRGSDRAS